MKQTKKQVFLEKISFLGGMDQEKVANTLEISIQQLTYYMSGLGGDCLHIREGKLVVDKEWEEIQAFGAKDGHKVENLGTPNTDLWKRRRKEINYIEKGGLVGKRFNPGDEDQSLEFVRFMRELEEFSERHNSEILDYIDRHGTIGAERVG